MDHLKKLSLTRKIVIAYSIIAGFAGLKEGHWFGAALFLGIVYVLIKFPSDRNGEEVNSQSDEAEYHDADHYQAKADNFNQTSSSGSATWTDYDEHIHNQ